MRIRHVYVYAVSVVRVCDDMSNDITILSDSHQQMSIPDSTLDSLLLRCKRGFHKQTVGSWRLYGVYVPTSSSSA